LCGMLRPSQYDNAVCVCVCVNAAVEMHVLDYNVAECACVGLHLVAANAAS